MTLAEPSSVEVFTPRVATVEAKRWIARLIEWPQTEGQTRA